MKTRADQADVLISQLRSQIGLLRQAAVSFSSKHEEEALGKENENLKKEISEIRSQLTMAEIRNGVRQVPLPAKKVDAGDVNSASATPANALLNNQPDQKKAPAKDAKPNSKTESKDKPEKKGGDAKGKKSGKEAEPETMDISRLDLRVGLIVSAEKHPDADSLYVEQVDVGEDKMRTVVSGLVKHIPLQQMQNRLAVFMCNLKPAKMRGILSEGMIMCASSPEKVEILEPPAGVQPGDRVTFEGYLGKPDVQMNPKKKIWETLKPDIRTDGNKVANYKGVAFNIEGKGIVKAPTLADSQIS